MTGEPTDHDVVMERLGQAMAWGHQGRREEARSAFDELWDRVGPAGDALHRCAIAHSMADVQDDPLEELRWDERALEAAGDLTEERVRSAGIATGVRGFYPSLHLNLADVYLRLGQFLAAREQVDAGRASLDALPDDGYLEMIVDALSRIDGELADVMAVHPPDAGPAVV